MTNSKSPQKISASTPPDSDESPQELITAILNLSKLMERQLDQQRDWKLSLRNGLLAGLGGVIGATVVVSLIITITQPFRRLEAIGPMIDRLDSALSQPHRR